MMNHAISTHTLGFRTAESHAWQVDEDLWARLAPYLGEASGIRKAGHPRRDDRAILAALVWLLRTGAQWRAMPAELGAPSTCYGRFQEWVRTDVFGRALAALLLEHKRITGVSIPARALADHSLASPHRFRRLLTRWDRRDANYQAWRQLAAILVMSRRLDHARALQHQDAEQRLAG
ncbi:MAG TPA: transposase [Chloroflexota bacterium]|nr:transposase [Chloroflexota bacterium]